LKRAVETSLLQAFISVAEAGSFSSAAEQLELTQPAVSKRISALEKTLDTKLFDRIGKNIGLTEAGELLLPRAKRILGDVRETETVVHNLSNRVTGELELATSHHIGLHRLPPVLKKFSNRYREVALNISFLGSEVAHEQVLQGNIELAVITLAEEETPRIQSRAIWNDPLFFVVAGDHPLAHKRGVGLEEIQNHPAILPEEETVTRRIINDLFDEHACKLRVSMATNYLETIKMMVSIGLGWSVLPESLIDKKLKKLSVKNIKLKRRLGYIYHENRTLSNAAAAFIRILEQYGK
jgi:DNA-binding transcriptional LysR family regulator